MRLSMTALAVPAVIFTAVAVTAADEVRLKSGERLSGEWQLEQMVLATDSGEVIVPIFNVLSIRSGESGSSVTLTDGTTLEGMLDLAVVELQIGLVSRRIPLREIAEIRLETSPQEIAFRRHEAGRYIQVDDLPMGGPEVSVSCPLRLRVRLPSRFKEGTWTSATTRLVECDGAISIPVVEFAFRQHRNGSGHLTVKPSIRVKPPQDKLVALSLALEIGGREIATNKKEGIDAEESGLTWKRLNLELPLEVVTAWSAGAEAFLTIDLSAVDH